MRANTNFTKFGYYSRWIITWLLVIFLMVYLFFALRVSAQTGVPGEISVDNFSIECSYEEYGEIPIYTDSSNPNHFWSILPADMHVDNTIFWGGYEFGPDVLQGEFRNERPSPVVPSDQQFMPEVTFAKEPLGVTILVIDYNASSDMADWTFYCGQTVTDLAALFNKIYLPSVLR